MHRKPDYFLLDELKAGNPKAFDAIFVKYYKLLVANAYFYLRDEQEAKDVVQDFLFEFWKKELYMRLEGDIKGYLYRSVQNRCINFHRKQMLVHQKFALIDRKILYDCEEDMEEKERTLNRLQSAMNNLTPQRKEALHRVFFEDKKYQEAADEMGVSINTLKTHLKTGIRNLREKLKTIKPE